MILRKILKTVANRSHILKLQCTEFDFGWSPASALIPHWGSLQRSPKLLAGFYGPSYFQEG